MQMQAVVDRIVEGKAVLLLQPEEKEELHWPVDYLPQKTAEGDILNIDLSIDREATEETREKAKELINRLKNKNN